MSESKQPNQVPNALRHNYNPLTGGQVIDGFMSPRRIKTQPAVPKVAHPAGSAGRIHSKTQKSATLMRSVVKKPSEQKSPKPSYSQQQKFKSSVSQPISKPVPLINRPSSSHANISRTVVHHRATLQSRNHLISKFGGANSTQVVKKTEHLKVQPSPFENVNNNTTTATAHHHHNQVKAVHAPQHTKNRRHRLAAKIGVHPSLLNAFAASFTGLMLLGFLAYQNQASVAMHIASSKSGVHVSAPKFMPKGFGIHTPIRYANGVVAIEFSTRDGKNNFVLTQRTSEWNSEALYAKLFSSKNQQPQVHDQNGQTVYIYGDGNATWVRGGIWYQIEGNTSFTSNDIFKIIASL